jgi:hypothetical protein
MHGGKNTSMSSPRIEKEHVAVVIVIPVGPTANYEFLQDTVESVETYCVQSQKIILVDNSDADTAKRLAAEKQNLVVVERTTSSGKAGKLYFNLAKAFEFALDRYDFDALLRIDDDGLVIGSGGDEQAIQFFRSNQNIAIIGSYRQTCTGQPRDFSPPADRIRHLLRARRFLNAPRLSLSLRQLLRRAAKYHYELGESCLGGVCFVNPAALRRMRDRGNLVRPEFIESGLEEDQIFALLAKASAFDLADFATGKLPVGAAWKGLPCSPDELELSGKKVIHSVRCYRDMNEVQIRAYFRDRRGAGNGCNTP